MKITTFAGAIILAVLGACTATSVVSSDSGRSIHGPADYTVYWDLPETGQYWVPKGTDVARILETGEQCEAKLGGGISHHIPVPPAYDYFVFYFIGPVSDQAKACVIAQLNAVPRLTVYEKKR